MIVDCASCQVRPSACADCVVGVLLGVPAPGELPAAAPAPGREVIDATHSGESEVPSGAPQLQLDAAERRALEVLADQGLIPRLRLVSGGPRNAVTDERLIGGMRDAM